MAGKKAKVVLVCALLAVLLQAPLTFYFSWSVDAEHPEASEYLTLYQNLFAFQPWLMPVSSFLGEKFHSLQSSDGRVTAVLYMLLLGSLDWFINGMLLGLLFAPLVTEEAGKQTGRFRKRQWEDR